MGQTTHNSSGTHRRARPDNGISLLRGPALIMVGAATLLAVVVLCGCIPTGTWHRYQLEPNNIVRDGIELEFKTLLDWRDGGFPYSGKLERNPPICCEWRIYADLRLDSWRLGPADKAIRLDSLIIIGTKRGDTVYVGSPETWRLWSELDSLDRRPSRWRIRFPAVPLSALGDDEADFSVVVKLLDAAGEVVERIPMRMHGKLRKQHRSYFMDLDDYGLLDREQSRVACRIAGPVRVG
jgi:hypothetical protein